MHIRGGHLLESGIGEQECLDVCKNHPLCLAVDYYATDGACFAHDGDTYCSKLRPLYGNVHYKRVPCVSGGRTTIKFTFSSHAYTTG